jgi:hypothetical protein
VEQQVVLEVSLPVDVMLVVSLGARRAADAIAAIATMTKIPPAKTSLALLFIGYPVPMCTEIDE